MQLDQGSTVGGASNILALFFKILAVTQIDHSIIDHSMMVALKLTFLVNF